MKSTFHTFKAQSNSSKRVRFAADAVDNSVPSKKNNSRRRFISKNKSVLKGLDVIHPIQDVKYSREDCKKKRHFFFPKEDCKQKSIEKDVVQCNLSDLTITDTKDGCILKNDKDDTIFILLPRSSSLKTKGHKDQLKKHVMLMQNMMNQKQTKRSKKREGVSSKEVTLGVKVARSHHGFIESSIKESNKSLWNGLCKYARQTEYATKEYISEGMLIGLKKGKEMLNWSTLNDSQIYSAFSVSKNYYSPAHTDEDFFSVPYKLSLTMVKMITSSIALLCIISVSLRLGGLLRSEMEIFFCLTLLSIIACRRRKNVLTTLMFMLIHFI